MVIMEWQRVERRLKEATTIIQAKLQETSVHSSLAREEGEVFELDHNTSRRVCNDRAIVMTSDDVDFRY
nr:hypothetical protein [Tanacetum cinerariifolium]